MALPDSGPLRLTDIQTEFGGDFPLTLSNYYAGGSFVPTGTSGTYGAVPSDGAISIQNFYGTSSYVPVPGVDWTNQPGFTSVFGSGASNIAYAVAASQEEFFPENTRYVAVGMSGGQARCVTSTDKVTWTVNSSFTQAWSGAGFTAIVPRAIIWAKNQFVVIGGYITSNALPRCVTSPDGINWTVRNFTFPWGNTGIPNAITYDYHSEMLIVVGENSKCATSLDGGVTWTVRAGFANFNGTAYAVGYSPSGWIVAVGTETGGNARCLVSINDGATWFVAPQFQQRFLRNIPSAMTWSDFLNGFVVVGSNGTCATSDRDGGAWTYQPGFNQVFRTNNFPDLARAVVSFLNTGLSPDAFQIIVVGQNGKCVQSLDGINWSNVPSFTEKFGSNTAFSIIAASEEYGYFDLIAVGSASKCITSP